MSMSFSMLELPHKCFFCHITKKSDTCAILKDKMGGRTKNATKMIIEGLFCSVLKGQDQFRE